MESRLSLNGPRFCSLYFHPAPLPVPIMICVCAFPHKPVDMILYYMISWALSFLYFFPILQKTLGKVWLCIPGFTGTYYIDQTGLKLTEIRGMRHHPDLFLFWMKSIFWCYLFFVIKEMHMAQANKCCANLAKAFPMFIYLMFHYIPLVETLWRESMFLI